MADLKTVLFLDPSEEWARILRHGLDGDVRMLWVQSARSVPDVYLSSPRVDLLVIGWMEGAETIKVIDWLHQREFVGKIIAATPSANVNKILFAAGCSQRVDDKSDLPRAVVAMLGDRALTTRRRRA